ncbi:PilC/PilY family type IV pilus protein [Desulfoluna spongiiphila]|uniref:PilC/PilY family type IV pilus protein n=1 Tax=Desulfoluna spongiiphila TaxID=419481 RepID=UPI0015874D4A|nr:PilC/PilY family type IV pilus protein [Desulfoluna spongiiphila]
MEAETGFADVIAHAHDLGTLTDAGIVRDGVLERCETIWGQKCFDKDYFTFSVNTPGTVTIYAKAPDFNPNLETVGYLYSTDDDDLMLESDNTGGKKGNFRIEWYLDTAGSYYTMLRGVKKRKNIGAYRLVLEFEPDEPTHYWDGDGDGWGDPNITTASPVGGGWVTQSGDCNDTNPAIHPGAEDNQCDSMDNDCDGLTDEDAPNSAKVLYYDDMDGDGYGNPKNSHLECTIPDGAVWVTNDGDCDDSDSSVNPDAIDICGDGVDQDCSSADRVCGTSTVCVDIADAPLTTQVAAAPPLVMFLLDDSGSMDFDILCDTGSFKFMNKGDAKSSGYILGDNNVARVDSWAHDVSTCWKTQWSGYNKVYYNPEVTYKPWPLYTNANPQSTRKHPYFNYGTRDMDAAGDFAVIYGVDLSYAHYYQTSGDKVYLVNLSGGAAEYYEVTDSGDEHYYEVASLTLLDSVPSAIAVTDYQAALQNMANWYQYSRNRELAAKSAVAQVISEVSGVKVGLYAINNGSVSGVKSIHVDGTDLTDTLLQKLYAIDSEGGTHLRNAFYNIGAYYDKASGDGGIGTSPFDSEENGGTCQKAFTIVMTDGYYNGDFDYSVGNADKNSTSDTSTWDGVPYADESSDTLADIAMHFYERDLRTDLADNVPTTVKDTAQHQHMVTYTVAFGVSGTLKDSNYDCPKDCPGMKDELAWPAPTSDKTKIDDLFHAAVNGRGKFMTAGNSEALANALVSVIGDIQNQVMSGASVSMNSQELKQDTKLYQGYFDSSNWTGNLKAFDLGTDSAGKLTTTKAWDAQEVMAAKSLTWWDSSRCILTNGESGSTAFRYGNLSDAQKESLSQGILDFVRGDSSGEKAKGGTYRDRDGLVLGDIVNSSPTYENGVVYVGANDGMLHAFDSADGNELFAYIPSFVTENLGYLADSEYTHTYFVDNTVQIRTIKNGISAKTWLVGGLGKGGRGYYGMDITNPTKISEHQIPTIWEYPAYGNTDPDMGFSYSAPAIVKANTGQYIILVGNGYDSLNGKAVLYALNMDGSQLVPIDTNEGSAVPADEKCNGLSSPVPIDTDFNGTVDIVYAGDMLGNLWKFDLSSSSAGAWHVAYDGHPLFTAKNKDGEIQPILGKPAVMSHCDRNRKGVMVIFGTGRYLANEDPSNTDIQSIYGIWDWADEWESPESRYLGALQQPTSNAAERTLSHFTDATLLKQSVTSPASSALLHSTSHAIDWLVPEEWVKAGAYEGGTHVGWYLDLPLTGERVVTKTQLLDGKAIVASIVPKLSPCTAGGGSVFYTLNACDGSQPDEPFFDSDGDGDVDDDDGTLSGRRFKDDIYYSPAILNRKGSATDVLIYGEDDGAGTAQSMAIEKEVLGLYYWRFVE